jgi:hypothetical protein
MMDKRTFVWRRIVELQELFTAALIGDAGGAHIELTPLRKLRIEQAAQATAVAEMARGKFMRDGDGDLDDLVRAERRADSLVKKLGLPQDKPAERPAASISLRERMIARHGEVEA